MYRYYNFNNDTLDLPKFLKWFDQVESPGAPSTTPISSLSMGYIKQNASEDLNWRPTHPRGRRR